MNQLFCYRSRSGAQGVNLCGGRASEGWEFDGFVAIEGPCGSYMFVGHFVALPFCTVRPGQHWRNSADKMLYDVAVSQGGAVYDCNGTFRLILPADGRALDGLRLAELAERACLSGELDETNWNDAQRRRAELWRAGLAGPVGDRIEISQLSVFQGSTLGPWEIKSIELLDRPDLAARQYAEVAYGDCNESEAFRVRVPADWPEVRRRLARQQIAESAYH